MSVTVVYGKFEWDQIKEIKNIRDHKCNFKTASLVFLDHNRIIAIDEKHSEKEPRFFLHWAG